MKILVTGGCGFIGSNFINFLLSGDSTEDSSLSVLNIDKLTYAGRGGNLKHMGVAQNPGYSFIESHDGEPIDIADGGLVMRVFEEHRPEMVFHFAAESHVDKSLKPERERDFWRTNVEGTENLLEAARRFPVRRFVHISTDEVYGSIEEGSFNESSPYNPQNPYSKSKTKAEELVLKYYSNHNIPVVITRGSNTYGPYQFPEKLIPLFITNLLNGEKVPLMWSEENPGLNVRDWLHVKDHCRAIWHLSQKGKVGRPYNIPGENEKTNIWITKKLLRFTGSSEEMIKKVPHRKQHDFRYSVDGTALSQTGFRLKHRNLRNELSGVVAWYSENKDWWEPLKSRDR